MAALSARLSSRACYPAGRGNGPRSLPILAVAAGRAGRDHGSPARPGRRGRPAVEKVRGRKFDRAVPAERDRPAELQEGPSRRSSPRVFPASPEDTLRTLVALGLIEETPNLIDKLDRLLCLAGHRVLRPGAAALLPSSRDRRRRAGGRLEATRRRRIGREAHLRPRADPRPPGRDPAPRPPDQGPEGQRRQGARAREPARGRGDARHDPGRARGAAGRRGGASRR